jgi:hypothetical protein
MSVSMVRKFGIAARIAGRMAGRRGRESRWLIAFGRGMRVAAHACGRVIRVLWLEVTGFVFLCLAGIGGVAFARELAKFEAGETTAGRLVLAICFTLTFAWFGVTSFWRARRRG